MKDGITLDKPWQSFKKQKTKEVGCSQRKGSK